MSTIEFVASQRYFASFWRQTNIKISQDLATFLQTNIKISLDLGAAMVPDFVMRERKMADKREDDLQ